MTTLLLAVMGQAKYVCAVHRFIQELLLKAAPELLKGSGALKSDKEFKDTIDVAIASVTTPHAKERDYVRAIVETSSAEMKPLCHLLRGAAEVVGLGELAARYLDGTRFREMLLRKDEEKLERLNVTVQTQGPVAPVKILMDVAAELDGRAENYDGMAAAAKRKAARDMTKLIGKVEEMRSAIERRIDEGKNEIVSHVDDVGAKIDKIKFAGKRRSKHTVEQKKTCLACWMSAQNNAELKSATKKGTATYEAALNWYKRQLALVGIVTSKKFRDVINSIRVKKCTDQKTALEAKREAERTAKKNTPHHSPLASSPLTTKKPKCGKIRGMRKRTADAMIGPALSIFAVAASCMASGASPNVFRGGAPLLRRAS